MAMKPETPHKTLLCLALLLTLTPKPTYQALSSDPNPSQPSTPSKLIHRASNGAHIRFIFLGILFGSLTGFAASIVFLYLVRLFLLFANRTPILTGPVIFSPPVSPKALQSVLSNDVQSLQLLGSSPTGNYYKVVLDDEIAVAVKMLELHSSAGSSVPSSSSQKRKLQQELEMLARVKHRNVMSLWAYVRGHDRLALVYDFVPGGSLEDAMQQVRLQQIAMGWDVRHRIAVGVVKGLRYLHFECNPRILHCRLKPSNVMLDEGFEPRLGDSALATVIVSRLDAPSSAHYVAPECFQNCRYTDKDDIYGFGMILAVLLTGRDPSDSFFSGETGRGSMCRWLRHLQQAGEAREALDKGILGEELEEEEMLMAIRIALVCLSDLPADRPSSDELVPMLTQLHSF